MMSLGSSTLQHAHVHGDQLIFSTTGGLVQALQDGFFRLSIPKGLDLNPGLVFAREFYQPKSGDETDRDEYRGYRNVDSVYFDREHFQTEHVLADRPSRTTHFPRDLNEMIEKLNDLALLLLWKSLASVGIGQEHWYTVTGGAVENRGTHWFAANHYRPEKNQLGCAPHKDTGFVTILYIEETGLEADMDGQWVPIEPTEGDFLVNFGGAFELLTKQLETPVKAVHHRVRHWEPGTSSEDRFSFAAFVNPPPTGDLYQMKNRSTPCAVQTVEDFLRTFNQNTWNDQHSDFGITTF